MVEKLSEPSYDAWFARKASAPDCSEQSGAAPLFSRFELPVRYLGSFTFPALCIKGTLNSVTLVRKLNSRDESVSRPHSWCQTHIASSASEDALSLALAPCQRDTHWLRKRSASHWHGANTQAQSQLHCCSFIIGLVL